MKCEHVQTTGPSGAKSSAPAPPGPGFRRQAPSNCSSHGAIVGSFVPVAAGGGAVGAVVVVVPVEVEVGVGFVVTVGFGVVVPVVAVAVVVTVGFVVVGPVVAVAFVVGLARSVVLGVDRAVARVGPDWRGL